MTSTPSPRRKRPPLSKHGLLFGGDALYQLLAYLAQERPEEFSTLQLATRIKRTPEHTRSEIDKLIELGVLEQVGNDRKTRLYGITDSTLSDELLDLRSYCGISATKSNGQSISTAVAASRVWQVKPPAAGGVNDASTLPIPSPCAVATTAGDADRAGANVTT